MVTIFIKKQSALSGQHSAKQPPLRVFNFTLDTRTTKDEKLTMLVILKASYAMSRLPPVNQDFRILRLITKRASEAAMILVRVRQHYAAYVRDAKARTAQPFAQSFRCLFRLRPGINQRDGVFGNEVAVDRPDVEGCGN